jgi:hypothetical protein
MIMEVSSREKVFKFVNLIDTSDPSYYLITIRAGELQYVSGQSYYTIKYTYSFEGNPSSKKYIHPFYPEDDAVEKISEIFKNAMTAQMVDYLLADPEELEKVSGSIDAQTYRTLIIHNLSRLT